MPQATCAQIFANFTIKGASDEDNMFSCFFSYIFAFSKRFENVLVQNLGHNHVKNCKISCLGGLLNDKQALLLDFFWTVNFSFDLFTVRNNLTFELDPKLTSRWFELDQKLTTRWFELDQKPAARWF